MSLEPLGKLARDVQQLNDFAAVQKLRNENFVKCIDELQTQYNKLFHLQTTVNYLKFEDMKQYYTVEPSNKSATWQIRKDESIPVQVLKLNKEGTRALIVFQNKKGSKREKIVKIDTIRYD